MRGVAIVYALLGENDLAFTEHVAPPGYYMLFLLDERGVPSEAKFVRLCL